MLTTLLPPTSGDAWIGGFSIRKQAHWHPIKIAGVIFLIITGSALFSGDRSADRRTA